MPRLNINEYDCKDILKIVREWTGLTQEEFGKRIGKSKYTIQDYELGNYTCNLITLKMISKTFGIDIIFTNKIDER